MIKHIDDYDDGSYAMVMIKLMMVRFSFNCCTYISNSKQRQKEILSHLVCLLICLCVNEQIRIYFSRLHICVRTNTIEVNIRQKTTKIHSSTLHFKPPRFTQLRFVPFYSICFHVITI